MHVGGSHWTVKDYRSDMLICMAPRPMFFFPLFHRYVHTDYIYHQWCVYHSDNIFVNHLTLFQALLFCTNKNQKKKKCKKDKQKTTKKKPRDISKKMFQETITIYGRAIQVPLSRERMHGKKTMKDHEEALKRSKDRSAVKLCLKHQFSMKLLIT